MVSFQSKDELVFALMMEAVSTSETPVNFYDNKKLNLSHYTP
jgi:hypothetical protein